MSLDPVVRSTTLSLGELELPPSLRPESSPRLVLGEAMRWRGQCQQRFRIVRPLLASANVTTDDLVAECDYKHTYMPGEWARLAVHIDKKRHTGASHHWIAAALLVVEEDLVSPPEPEGSRRIHVSERAKSQQLIMPLVREPYRGTTASDADTGSNDYDGFSFECRPDRVFRGHRLIVECESPLDVDVVWFSVGNRVQFAAFGAVSAAIFTPSMRACWSQDTATPAHVIDVRLVNRSDRSITAKVSIEGKELA
jgi:hypothetical protein